MGLLSNAVLGSVWRLRNGKTATYVCRSTDPAHRQHTLEDDEDGSPLWRYDNGTCYSEDEAASENAWDPVELIETPTSKYPSNYAHRSH